MSSTPEKQIHRPRPITGFPEWLPEQRRVELTWMDEIRRVFESYGFASVETPSVEDLDVLLAKGETDKEIYTIQRLQGEGDEAARLGLHYDLTVPLARYVAQHFNELVFPFKRYQIQRVWRGERPQEGRFREFYQCDIDVINVDEVPLHFDAELPAIIYEILRRLDVGEAQLQLSNRKILEGYFQGLGITDTVAAIRIVDKLDKLGPAGVVEQLGARLSLDAKTAERVLAIGRIRTEDASFVDQVKALGVRSDLLDKGLEELAFVVEALAELPRGSALADLSIARGFDYYTGSIYECRLREFPQLGSVCSGGRYDDLAGAYINRRLPGVGISIGLSRLFAKMLGAGRLPVGPKCPTEVLVVFPNEEQRQATRATARALRERGLKVETYHAPGKISHQLRYASRKSIPYVWFPPFDAAGVHEVKEMASGQQGAADPAVWLPAPRTGQGG